MGWQRSLVIGAARGTPARVAIGLVERVAKPPRGAFSVLTYHRVDDPRAKPWLYPALLSATPDEFEAQMEAVARHYRPLALPELLAAYRGERDLPPRSVLITVDDAYRDFRENAWPVLRRLGVPVTLFVPTGYPDQPDRAFWWDRLWYAVTQPRRRASLETALGLIELGDERQRRQAGRSLIEYHKTLAHDEAIRSVEDTCDRLDAPHSRSEVLSWSDLRQLAAEGVCIAAHSRNHPLLTRVPQAALAAEIDGSRTDLQANLPDQAYGSVFAYPGGEHNDRTVALLSRLGIDLAFTTVRGGNRLGYTNRLRLRRINVGVRSHVQLIRGQIAIGTLRGTIGR